MELLEVAFWNVNLPWTLLLGVLLLYWAGVIFGALDISLFDVDAGVDIDVDAGADAHADTAAGGHGGWMLGFFKFLNIGELPVMIVLSFFVLSVWSISVAVNYYLNPVDSLLWGAALLVPNVLVSLLVARFLGLPFRALFRKLETDKEQQAKVVGQTCIIKTSQVTSKFGQAEIATDGAPITLNVWAREEEHLVKGDQALIVDYDRDRDAYKVVKFELEV
jgi:hypothetical protein